MCKQQSEQQINQLTSNLTACRERRRRLEEEPGPSAAWQLQVSEAWQAREKEFRGIQDRLRSSSEQAGELSEQLKLKQRELASSNADFDAAMLEVDKLISVKDAERDALHHQLSQTIHSLRLGADEAVAALRDELEDMREQLWIAQQSRGRAEERAKIAETKTLAAETLSEKATLNARQAAARSEIEMRDEQALVTELMKGDQSIQSLHQDKEALQQRVSEQAEIINIMDTEMAQAERDIDTLLAENTRLTGLVQLADNEMARQKREIEHLTLASAASNTELKQLGLKVQQQSAELQQWSQQDLLNMIASSTYSR